MPWKVGQGYVKGSEVMKQKTCEKCKWWADHGQGERPEVGSCRRKAPLPWVPEDIGFSIQRAVWPRTLAVSWCGDFTSKKRKS